MKIETKYNIGDEVWFDSLGRITKATICTVRIFLFKDGCIIVRYTLCDGCRTLDRNEHEIFFTKEDLLKSLLDDSRIV